MISRGRNGNRPAKNWIGGRLIEENIMWEWHDFVWHIFGWWFSLFEKYSQTESFPQVGVERNQYLKIKPPPTLPETNIAHENPIFPGKYHQNCGFSMAMLVSGSVMDYFMGGYLNIPQRFGVDWTPQICAHGGKDRWLATPTTVFSCSGIHFSSTGAKL